MAFAHGATLTMGSAMANLTSINGIGMTRDTIDVTTHDSSDKFKEYVAGLGDGGEIAVTGIAKISTDITQFTTLLTTGAVTNGAIISLPTNTKNTTFTFDGIVTAFTADAPHDGALTFSASIKVTGKPTFVQAT